MISTRSAAPAICTSDSGSDSLAQASAQLLVVDVVSRMGVQATIVVVKDLHRILLQQAPGIFRAAGPVRVCPGSRDLATLGQDPMRVGKLPLLRIRCSPKR